MREKYQGRYQKEILNVDGDYMSKEFASATKQYKRLTNLDDEGVINLTCAILDDLAKEYERVIKDCKTDRHSERVMINYYYCLSYLESEYFNTLTLGNGDEIKSIFFEKYGKMDQKYINKCKQVYDSYEKSRTRRGRRPILRRTDPNKNQIRGSYKKEEQNG